MREVLLGCLAFAGAAMLGGLALVGVRDRRRNISPDLLPDDLREKLGLWSGPTYRQGALIREDTFLSPQFRNSRRVGLTFTGAAVLLLLGCLLVALGLSGASGGFVPKVAAPPHGVDGRTFKPAGLGLAVDVPLGWKASPPASGFDYALTGTAARTGYLFAAHQPTASSVSPAALLDQRRSILTSRGATIKDGLLGKIHGHQSVRLRYRLPAEDGRPAVDDVEYDVLLPKGSAIIVVGLAAGHTDPVLVSWISSTIRPSP